MLLPDKAFSDDASKRFSKDTLQRRRGSEEPLPASVIGPGGGGARVLGAPFSPQPLCSLPPSRRLFLLAPLRERRNIYGDGLYDFSHSSPASIDSANFAMPLGESNSNLGYGNLSKYR